MTDHIAAELETDRIADDQERRDRIYARFMAGLESKPIAQSEIDATIKHISADIEAMDNQTVRQDELLGQPE